jgi:hypothetical protein
VFAPLRHRAGGGANGVSIRAPAEQRISRNSVTERDRRVIVILYICIELAELSKVT